MSTLRAHRALAVLLALQAAFPPPNSACAEHIVARIDRLVQQVTYHGTEPETGIDGAVEMLAENIDWLEKHIDTYGSVVAKSPDIWGEARLTKYRDEYERIMFRELTNFQVKINASIAQSDSAFLAQALALSAAASGTAGTLPTTNTAVTSGAVVATLADAGSALAPPAEKQTFSRFGIADENKISLEPVIGLDQLSRYLDHLHELRRVNEGDDTSDSPGYSLNLVRIPVSILPGKLTRTGFGAEVTVTCAPVITDDLMPTTFHNLAVNDMVDLLGLPLLRVSEGIIFGKLNAEIAQRTIHKQSLIIEAELIHPRGDSLAIRAAIKAIMNDETAFQVIDGMLAAAVAAENRLIAPKELATHLSARQLFAQNEYEVVQGPESEIDVKRAISTSTSLNPDLFMKIIASPTDTNKANENGSGKLDVGPGANGDQSGATKSELNRLATAFHDQDVGTVIELLSERKSDWRAALQDLIAVSLSDLEGKSAEQIATVSQTGRARRALNPLNPTSVTSVMGMENLITIAQHFEPAYSGRYIRWNGGRDDGCEKRVDLLDAQRFLQAELEAAYELLSQPENVRLYTAFAAPCSELAKQIRAGHLTERSPHAHSVEEYRHCFFEKLHECCATPPAARGAQLTYPVSASSYEEQLPDGGPEAGESAPPALFVNADIGTEGLDATASGTSTSLVGRNSEARNTVEALAWALVVESALLNERLNLDVRKVAKSKQAYQLDTQRDYLFFLPETVNAPNAGLEELQGEFQEAADIFKEYVKVRWPIHVFAIDPREQDQNVADVSARKRELQFALALGFVSGQIGVNSLTQFSRELQTQIETIALNRTIVGFGHGDDTFGWRFQPRVQGLFEPNTLGAIRETLCGVSRDYDLRHRQLEPGQRDCTAIVLMPSFVPYADFDVRTNWYKLTNPKNSAITMKETVHLSRAITAMRNSQAQCSECADLYREHEVGRLLNRVDQLDHELPLQTMRVLVPYENTVGGFEMFNTGVTDLSPELIGWYGAPGIVVKDDGKNQFSCGCTRPCGTDGNLASIVKPSNQLVGKTDDGKQINVTVGVSADPLPICEGEGTSVFLVGDNFSVHDTRVIAGGVCIPSVQLVSRQIMRITVPSCVQTVHLCENGQTNEYVAVYVATPYGVTNHLHVPVHRIEPPHSIISVAPADPANKTVKLKATYDASKKAIEFSDSKSVDVVYKYSSDPKYDGKKVSFYVVAVLDGAPKTEWYVAKTFDRITASEKFDALGIEPKTNILANLSKKLNPTLFVDKKLRMKLAYSAVADDQITPQQVPGEIDVEIELVEKPAVEKPAGDSTTNAPSLQFLPAQWQPRQQTQPKPFHVESMPPLPATSESTAPDSVRGPDFYDPTISVPIPVPTSTSTDCDCGQTNNAIYAGRVSASAPAAPRRLPVQWANFEDTGVSSDPPAEQLPVPMTDVSQQLSEEIRTLKEQIAAQQVAIQAALDREMVGYPVAGAALAGQSVVNVNVQQSPNGCAWLCDQLECPITHRFYVRGRECWRNVRDQLPCN